MKKNAKKIVFLTGFLVIFCGIVVYSAVSTSVTVSNFLSMGDINISLKEYARTADGQEKKYPGSREILPGEEISKIPRITNLAEPCYVRARVLYENSDQELEGFSDANLRGFTKDWKKLGEYYYYTKILQHGEAVDLFQSVKIPESWTEKHSEQTLKIIVEAESLQAVHFTPDFQAASPWRNLPVETCIHEEDGKTIRQKEKLELTVDLQGEAYRLVAAPKDFFSNFPTLMPGDSLSDEITLMNHTDQEAELFFRTGLEKLTKEERDLLEKIELRIQSGEEVIYSGNLLAESIEKEISLGKYPPGAQKKLTFQISVPAALGNAYARRQGNVKWIFSTSRQEESPKEPENTGNGWSGGGGSGSGSAGGEAAGVSGGGSSSTSDVRTGDTANGKLWILLLTAAGLLSAIVLRVKGGK